MMAFVIIGFVLLMYGCKGKQQQKTFYYYPKANVYYDTQRSLYYYSLNGGQSWDSVPKLIAKEPATLGNKEIIYTTATPPYANNSADRKKYGGSVFSFVSNVNTLNDIDSGATERVIKKSARSKSGWRRSGSSSKKGLKGFFRKIFGKHNK